MSKNKLIYSKKYDGVFKYETKSGWLWGYRYPYYDGFHRRKEASKRRFSTAKDAYTALLDVQRSLVSGQTSIVANNGMTVNQWADIWIQSMSANWSASTNYAYREVIKNYISPLLGRVKLSELTRIKYQALYLNNLKHLSEGTQRIYHKKFITMLNAAVNNDVIPANKLKNFSFGKSTEKCVMTAEQLLDFNRLMRQNTTIDNRVFLLILEFTGMRKGEALALTWDDVDLENNVIHITKTRDVWGTHKPKTESSVRDVPFEDSLHKEIANYKRIQWRRFNKRGIVFKNSGLLLTSASNIPITPGETHYRLSRLFQRIGWDDMVGRFTLHSFRHTHATLLIDSGLPVKTVAKRLGHSDVATTLKYYTHDLPGRQRDASTQFENLLKPKAM